MRALLDLVAPTICVACATAAGSELCARCAEQVTVIGEPMCPRCGGPRRGARCACEQLMGFERARSLVVFAEPARALTLSLKRYGRRSTAAGIGGLLAALASSHGLHTGTVTFVPGGRAARSRGFDHAELLARSVARSLGSRVERLLTRTDDGPRQADVSFADRRTNVRQRFAARATAGTILLVDDVFTTGATAEACATALTRAGAVSVDVVTWARTLRRSV